MKKKIAFLSLALASVVYGTNNVQAQAIQCEDRSQLPASINQDTCIYNSVLLQNIEKKEDKISAKVNGEGTLVVQTKKSGGFPRLIVLGNTTVTGPSSWDGSLSTPKYTRMPNASKFFQTDINAEFPQNVKVERGYQFGLGYASLEFSQKAYASLWVNAPNGTQLFIAQERGTAAENAGKPISSLEWEFDSSRYCTVKNSICMIELPKSVNRIALAKKISQSCPEIKIENGSFSEAPECNIVCNENFVFDANQNKCVTEEEFGQDIETIGEFDTARQGYFRYRGTREGQLETATAPSDANKSEKNFVNTKNAAVTSRTQDSKQTNTGDKTSLWKEFQEFVWTNDTTGEYHKPRHAQTTDATQTNTTKKSTHKRYQNTAKGSILPRTGAGAFAALAIAGIATMAFAMRRRQ